MKFYYYGADATVDIDNLKYEKGRIQSSNIYRQNLGSV